VLHNNVLNGLVIDLKKVDQVVMVMAVNNMVVKDLDHHIQKEMDLDLTVNVLHVQNGMVHDPMEDIVHIQNRTVRDPMVNVHPAPNGMVLARIENDLKAMVTVIVDLVVNMDEEAKMINIPIIKIMNRIILTIMISM